jgi:hypothetical protein
MRSFDWYREAHVTCDKSSCQPSKLHRVTLSIFFPVEKDIFLNQSYIAFHFPGYKTGNVSTIKILPQSKRPNDFTFQTTLKSKNYWNKKMLKIQRKLQRPPLDVSDNLSPFLNSNITDLWCRLGVLTLKL